MMKLDYISGSLHINLRVLDSVAFYYGTRTFIGQLTNHQLEMA